MNRQIILSSRPKGLPDPSNFILREAAISDLKDGEVLVRLIYLSVDPYMRGRMNDRPSYVEPFQLNQPLTGGAVGRVIASKSEDFKAEDIVAGFMDWADYSVVQSKNLRKLDSNQAPISTALGVLGMPGMTAYFGLLDIGKPKVRETVVVSGAAGAVGSLVGQIAKIHGCRVVGIAGSDEKTQYLIRDLGFDAAINYKHSNDDQQLTTACPNGIDIYFDNVGGEITDQVLKQINKHARIIICGQISMYNLEKPDIGPRPFSTLLMKSALAQGFLVYDYLTRFAEGMQQMAQWLKEGKVKYRETIVDGLENAPSAFLGLFKGENIGKEIVRISKE